MKKTMKFLAGAVLVIAAAACASPAKMAKMAENVKIESDPAVLEAVAGQVATTVSVTYPKDYFNPKAILEVTPVIVYDGGEARLPALKYQGEKVKDNYKVVSSNGQTVTENLVFDYVDGMQSCYLELRGVAKVKKKSVNLPAQKVAVGCNTTYMLVETDAKTPLKADGYQDVIALSSEGQILYLVNSSEVRSGQLNSQSIKDFQAALDKIAADERTTLKGTEIVAYASPEGEIDLNNKLSGKRSESASEAWKKVTKGHEAADPELKSAGEDWEGFQKLVSESDIQDKNLILRVLSMYSDPAVRESEIRNMSEIFTELKGEVLPELRRARLIVNSEYQNYTADELKEIVDKDVESLDEAALLRSATLYKDASKKISLYQKAIDKFDSNTARFNLATVYLGQDKLDAAEKLVRSLDKDADVKNLLGVIALRQEEYDVAARYFTEAGTDAAKYNLGIVDILTGEYEKAIEDLKDWKGCCFNRSLAFVLNGQLEESLANMHCNDPKIAYLKAIIAARQGDGDKVTRFLSDATSRSEELRERAATDIEFVDFR